MSRGVSTARRYNHDNGPIVFGTPDFDVRWNRLSQTVVVTDRDGGEWSQSGEIGALVLVALAAAQRKGRLREALREMLTGARAALSIGSDFYRCGKVMFWRPSWQEALL